MLINIQVNKTLVNTLIAAANQDGTIALRPLGDGILSEHLADRRKQHDRCWPATLFENIFYATPQGFSHQNHARAAAKGAVVYPPILPIGKIT